MTRGRRGYALLLLLLVVVVNLPLVHSSWTAYRVERSGVDVTAIVRDSRTIGSGDAAEHWVSFTFPERIDPDQRTWRAEVDEASYDDAVDTGKIEVRVLEDDPSAYRAEGTADSRALLAATLIADAVLLVVALLVWRFGGRPRAQLRAVALEDVERGTPDVLLERLHGEDYLVRGEVLSLADGEVVLDLGNRTIVVLLDGHHNPVGYQQPAQVRARMIS